MMTKTNMPTRAKQPEKAGVPAEPDAKGLRLHVERLRLKNFKVFHDAVMECIPDYCALVGHIASGRRTLFDAFAFLQDSLAYGVGKALSARGGIRDVASRGHGGESIALELVCKADNDLRLAYTLEVAQRGAKPVVVLERLERLSPLQGCQASCSCLFEYREGRNVLVPAVAPFSLEDGAATGALSVPGRPGLDLVEPDTLALGVFGVIAECRESCALRHLLEDVQMPNFSGHRLAKWEPAGTHGGLPALAWWLQEEWPARFQAVVDLLRGCDPDVKRLAVARATGGQIDQQARIAGFGDSFFEPAISISTRRLFELFVSLHDPWLPQAMRQAPVLLDEPERGVPPHALPLVSMALRGYARERQVLVATDSPDLLDTLDAGEVYCLQRGQDGFSRIQRATDDKVVAERSANGEGMGSLWRQGAFDQPLGWATVSAVAP